MDELETLHKLHKQFESEFKFPDIDLVSSLYVVTENDEILGFGAIQPIFELIMVLDQNRSTNDKMEALHTLMSRAVGELSSQDISQMHVFVQNKKFSNMLKKRFDFVPTKGEALVRIL